IRDRLLTLFTLQATAKPIPVLLFNYDFGGDRLIDVTYADGTHSKIDAGNGLLFGGGAIWDFYQKTDFNLQLQSNIAYKFQSVKEASNGNGSWDHIPFEVLGYYNHHTLPIRAGVGLTYQFGNKFKGSGFLEPYTTKFKNTTGSIIDVDYKYEKYYFGLRATNIEYKSESTGKSVSGNSIGLTFSMTFPEVSSAAAPSIAEPQETDSKTEKSINTQKSEKHK
ncbi:MAG: hypothetical protein ABL927_03355, partial [Bdellovibrionales bacterium]